MQQRHLPSLGRVYLIVVQTFHICLTGEVNVDQVVVKIGMNSDTKLIFMEFLNHQHDFNMTTNK